MQCYHFTSVLNPKSTIVVVVGGGVVVVAVTNMCLVLGLLLHLHVHSGPSSLTNQVGLGCPGSVPSSWGGSCQEMLWQSAAEGIAKM